MHYARTVRDARTDWANMEAADIPSKSATPHLDTFLERARGLIPHSRPSLLDLGCGDGRLSVAAARLGFRVMGVDINPGAIQTARARLAELTESMSEESGASFHCCDIASSDGLGLVSPAFDVAVCQLVVSIVGPLSARRQLVKNAFDALRIDGLFYISASGVSGDINANYADLYAQDSPVIGEENSYYSRGPDGAVLYTTHHLTQSELFTLLDDAGFREVAIQEERESSSRRPGETARFLYATALKG